MKKLILILLILNSIFAFSQTVKFNKSYVPIGNDLSNIYNIVTTDTNYLCYGVSQYIYPQALLSFSINTQGNQNQIIGIYDMQGHLLKQQKAKDVLGMAIFDVSNLSAGTYIVKMGKFKKQISIIH